MDNRKTSHRVTIHTRKSSGELTERQVTGTIHTRKSSREMSNRDKLQERVIHTQAEAFPNRRRSEGLAVRLRRLVGRFAGGFAVGAAAISSRSKGIQNIW